MSKQKLTLGRYNEKNEEKGSSLHKGLMIQEAKDMGYTGLTQATKEELNSLVNYGDAPNEEAYDIRYNEIRKAIKERNKKEKETRTPEEMQSVYGNILDSDYEKFISNYPEIPYIEQGRLPTEDYEEQGKLHSYSKKEIKNAKDNVKYFIQQLNNKYEISIPKMTELRDLFLYVEKQENKYTNIISEERRKEDLKKEAQKAVNILDEPKTNIKKNDEINILSNNNTMSDKKVIRKFKKGNLLPPKTIENFKPMLRPKVSSNLLLEEEDKSNKKTKLNPKIKVVKPKVVQRKPTWKYSPAMKKAQLEAFIKEHGIPAPDHPKSAELRLLISDYVTHLIMDDMRRHERGEPLQNANIEAMKKMREYLVNLEIPKVEEIPKEKMDDVLQKGNMEAMRRRIQQGVLKVDNKQNKILEKFKKGKLSYKNKILESKPFKNIKSLPKKKVILKPKAKAEKVVNILKPEPEQEIEYGRTPIKDKTKYKPIDFQREDLQDDINDIEKEIEKLDKKADQTLDYRKAQAIDKKIDELKKELNQKYDEFKALGKGGKRRMRGGNFGDDLLGVMSKIGKIGTNLPLIGPAFIPMSHSSDIGNFVKNL